MGAARCFASGLSGALARLAAPCSGGNVTQATLAAALDAIPALGLAVAASQPAGSSLWGYNLPSYIIRVHLRISNYTFQYALWDFLGVFRSVCVIRGL